MAAGEQPSSAGAAGRATLLLQRTRDLLQECRAVAAQLAVPGTQESQAAAGERIAYGVLVAALEEGLMAALQNAVDVVRRFSAAAGPLGEEWLRQQKRKLGGGSSPDAPADLG